MSEKPDSNRRPQPWQGCALPTELLSLVKYPRAQRAVVVRNGRALFKVYIERETRFELATYSLEGCRSTN